MLHTCVQRFDVMGERGNILGSHAKWTHPMLECDRSTALTVVAPPYHHHLHGWRMVDAMMMGWCALLIAPSPPRRAEQHTKEQRSNHAGFWPFLLSRRDFSFLVLWRLKTRASCFEFPAHVFGWAYGSVHAKHSATTTLHASRSSRTREQIAKGAFGSVDNARLSSPGDEIMKRVRVFGYGLLLTWKLVQASFPLATWKRSVSEIGSSTLASFSGLCRLDKAVLPQNQMCSKCLVGPYI
jgi:hypothetical protein